jgi:hypothetical protein
MGISVTEHFLTLYFDILSIALSSPNSASLRTGGLALWAGSRGVRCLCCGCTVNALTHKQEKRRDSRKNLRPQSWVMRSYTRIVGLDVTKRQVTVRRLRNEPSALLINVINENSISITQHKLYGYTTVQPSAHTLAREIKILTNVLLILNRLLQCANNLVTLPPHRFTHPC